MERKSLDRLQEAAKIYADYPRNAMSKRERMERWSQLLELQPDRLLSTFTGTEHVTSEARDKIRCDNSPISVAFEDPILRAEGLTDDTYGAAKKFFNMSDWQLHRVVCYCHHGSRVYAQGVAYQVRAACPKPPRLGFITRALRALGA